MTLFVVDSSVAVKWFFTEEHSERALRVLEGTHELHAPDIFFLEVDSVVCKRIRRREIDEATGREIRSELRQFPVHTHEFLRLLDPAFEIAVATGRALYDCLYLALAALLQVQLITADRRLFEGLLSTPLNRQALWIENV